MLSTKFPKQIVNKITVAYNLYVCPINKFPKKNNMHHKYNSVIAKIRYDKINLKQTYVCIYRHIQDEYIMYKYDKTLNKHFYV